MEIYIKKHEQMHKIHWLNSLPGKYKDEIIDQILDCGVDLTQEKQYKIVVDILKKKQESGEKPKEWRQYRNQAVSPSAVGSPKAPSSKTCQSDLVPPNAEQSDEQLASFEGNQQIKKQLLAELMEDVNLKKAEKRRELILSRQSNSKQFSPARGGPIKRLMMAQAYSEKMLNQYPQNQNKALPFQADQVLMQQSGAGGGQISIADLHGLYQTIQNELFINLAQVQKLQSSPDAKNLKYQIEIDQTIANLTAQLAQIEHLIQRQKSIIQLQNEQIQQQMHTDAGASADLKVNMAESLLRDSKDEVATVLVRTVSQQADTQFSHYPQLQTKSYKALQALAPPSQRGLAGMTSSQHAASRLDTHSASEPKVVEQQIDEEGDEYIQEQVLSSNSAATTAKKGITPKYINKEQILAEKSSGTATQKLGSGNPKKKQAAIAPGRIQSGKVKLKQRANQNPAKPRIEEVEADQAFVKQSREFTGKEPGPLPTSDFLQTSQSRSNKKSLGRQNMPGSIVSVGDLDQLQSSNCTYVAVMSADRKSQQVQSQRLYTNAQAALGPLAESALKIDSIIELEATEAERQQHATRDYRASISTNAAKTNKLPKIDESQERAGPKEQPEVEARAETHINSHLSPSAVQINRLTKIKSGEFSSKQKVLRSRMQETAPNAEANQIEQIYEKYHQQMAKVAVPEPSQGRFRALRAAGSRAKMIPSEARICSPISQRQQSQQKFITFNYIGSVKNSFGILKTAVPIRDKYQSYIDRAVSNYDREKQRSNLNYVDGRDSEAYVETPHQLAGEHIGGNAQASNASLSRVNRANYFTGVPQTSSGIGMTSSQDEFGYIRSNHEPYAKNKRQFKARKLQAGQKPKMIARESEQYFKERYRDYQAAKIQEQRDINMRTSYHQASNGSYDASLPHQLEPKPLPLELVHGINSTTSTGRSQNPWLDGKVKALDSDAIHADAGGASLNKAQSTIQMTQQSQLPSRRAPTAAANPRGMSNNRASAKILKDKPRNLRGGRGQGKPRDVGGLVIDPVLGPCIQGHGLQTTNAMQLYHHQSQNLRAPLSINQVANSPQMKTRTANLLLAHKRAGKQSGSKSKKVTPEMLTKRFVKNQELISRQSRPHRSVSRANQANPEQIYSAEVAEQAPSHSPFQQVQLAPRAATSTSGASGIHLGADGGKGTLLLPAEIEYQGSLPQQSYAFSGPRKFSNRSQGQNHPYERKLYGTAKNIHSKVFDELRQDQQQAPQPGARLEEQHSEERNFIKIHDSSGTLSVNRYSRKPNGAASDSCRRQNKKKRSSAQGKSSGARRATQQRPQSSCQERGPKLVNYENAMRQSQQQNQLTEMLAVGLKRDEAIARVGKEHQNAPSGIQTEQLTHTISPRETAHVSVGKHRGSARPQRGDQPEASPTKFMKKAYSLKIGTTNEFELQSKMANHINRRKDANYQTGGFNDKTRNKMVDAVTVNSFQNIEIQKNLSQKSASGLQDRGLGSPPLDFTEALFQRQRDDLQEGQPAAPEDGAVQPMSHRSSIHVLLDAENRARLAAVAQRADGQVPGDDRSAAMKEARPYPAAHTGEQGLVVSELYNLSETRAKPAQTNGEAQTSFQPHLVDEMEMRRYNPTPQHKSEALKMPVLATGLPANSCATPGCQPSQDQNEIYLRFLRFKIQKKEHNQQEPKRKKRTKHTTLLSSKNPQHRNTSTNLNSAASRTQSKSKLQTKSLANLHYQIMSVPDVPQIHTSKYQQRVLENQMFIKYRQ